MKYFEVEFSNEYSICCKGERIPSIEEAAVFCSFDCKENGEVVSVEEISLEDAHKFFDTDGIDSWPVFK